MVRLLKLAPVIGAAFCVAALNADIVHAQPPQSGQYHPEGIWKAAVPLESMRGEFDNFDPLGVAAGARIKADCSLNWVDPDDGKLYCFASGTSLEFFLDQPQAAIARARRAWKTLSEN